ncbi:UDP-glycosyltransferase UGT5-like [Topomyia yanbarensis]|uniref:UDP-glycosyltransferase UGT5-like n=1 Tax=Topomyia yanbarensis TaxID=2498891 RepID=UPI00273B75E3|nr:UDP-glycosyltransferase UGT5-like [Topomyia yanbarensis]
MRLLSFAATVCAILCCCYVAPSYGSTILAVFPSTSKTNYLFGQVLFEELAARGHRITVISPFEIQYDSENIKQIKLTGMFAHLEDYGMNSNIFTKWDRSSFYGNNNMVYGTAAMAEYTLGHPAVQELLKSDETLDLLILDQVLTDSLLGLALHYQIPAIVYSSTATNKFTNEMVANPHNPAYNPISDLGYSDQMSFTQRLWNTMVSVSEQFNYKYLYLPAQEAVYQRHFVRKNLPPLLDLIHNVSLVLVNSHPVINYPRPLVPSMIEVGGLHLRKFNESGLSEDVINWVEAAKKGVVYFSLGANTKSTDLPANVRKAFTAAFSQLSGTLILWKWENATLENQTSNVIIGPWMPQQELLAHPNVRLHITHGGLLGMMESVHYGKPILGIPLAGDQEILVDRAVRSGYGLKLNYQNITEEIVLNSIRRILEDNSFRTNALKASSHFREHPVPPLDKAIYYIEYVLRKDGGIANLRTGALKLNFWERHLVDVVLGFVGICLVPVTLIATIIQMILRKTHSKKLATANGGKPTGSRKGAMNKKTN